MNFSFHTLSCPITCLRSLWRVIIGSGEEWVNKTPGKCKHLLRGSGGYGAELSCTVYPSCGQ